MQILRRFFLLTLLYKWRNDEKVNMKQGQEVYSCPCHFQSYFTTTLRPPMM